MQANVTKSIAGLCSLCIAQTDDKAAPGTFRINGIGTVWFGSSSVCGYCGSVIRSHWLTVLWIPLLPLGKYRILQLQGLNYIGRKLSKPAKLMPWWFAKMHALQPNLIPLAVVQVRGDNTADQNRKMGETLNAWKSRNPQVQHIWGLNDLLTGDSPRSPCEYFLIPRSKKDLQSGHESVALVMVQADAEMNNVGNSLLVALEEVKSCLASLSDLDNYCYRNR